MEILMTQPISDLSELLRSLRPVQISGVFAFCTLPAGASIPSSTISWFREAEGISIILPLNDAIAAGLNVEFEAAWITLTVHSDLAAVGLTAAVATALTKVGISCNMVAGCRHDHLFVPVERAAEALRVLQQLAEVSET
jgi:hypothetical protein